MSFPHRVVPVFGSQRAYADLNFAGGSFGLNGTIVNNPSLLSGWTFTRASTAWGFGSNGYLQSFSSGTPRFVYDPVTLASLGILVEEARTNLALQSATLDSGAWGKTLGGVASAPVVTANYGLAPDGTMTADRVQFALNGGTTSTDRSLLMQSITVSNTTAYTLSFYVQSLGGSVALGIGADAIVGNTAITATSAWQRVSVTATSSGTSASIWMQLRGGQAPTQANSADVLIWGAQLEAGTGASSAIVTTSAAVTRAADVAVITGLTVTNPHTIVAEWTPGFDNLANFRRVVSLTDSAPTSEDVIYHRHTTNSVRAFTSTSMDLQLGIANAATSNKAAARFALNNSTGSLNGAATVSPDTSTAPTTNIDRLYVGTTASSNWMNGTISRIRIYNCALSDAQLQALTA